MLMNISYFENVETLPGLYDIFDSEGFRATILYDTPQKAIDGLREYPNHQIIISQYLGGGYDEELYRGEINDEAVAVIERTFADDKEWNDRVRLEKAIRECGKTVDEIIELLMS